MRDQGRGLSSDTTVLFPLHVQKARTHEVLFKLKLEADPLVVQGLRIHPPVQGTQVCPWSGKIPQALEQVSPCAPTTEAPTS